MRRVTGRGLSAVLVVVGMLAFASAASAKTHARAGTRGLGVLVPAHKGQVLPAHGGATDSLNWSGYAVTPSSDNVTAVAVEYVG